MKTFTLLFAAAILASAQTAPAPVAQSAAPSATEQVVKIQADALIEEAKSVAAVKLAQSQLELQKMQIELEKANLELEKLRAEIKEASKPPDPPPTPPAPAKPIGIAARNVAVTTVTYRKEETEGGTAYEGSKGWAEIEKLKIKAERDVEKAKANAQRDPCHGGWLMPSYCYGYGSVGVVGGTYYQYGSQAADAAAVAAWGSGPDRNIGRGTIVVGGWR